MEEVKIHCKKDFKGMVDVRDYIVKAAINDGNSIVITCGSFPGKSVYTPMELMKPSKISDVFKSKFKDAKDYRLYSYNWKFE